MLVPMSEQTAVGIVLVNLGTPDQPTLPAVQKYLREFLSDRRIVDLSPILWKPILETSIMHGHAKLSTQKYASVWYPEGSPLLIHSQALVTALAAGLGAEGPVVRCAMRYGSPALASVLDELKAAGVWRLLVVPLYAQYSTTTVATVIDALSAYLADSMNHPEVRWIRGWAEDPGYIDACARVIEDSWAENGRPDFARGDKLLLSYHGIPVSVAAAGDPYPQECQATTDRRRARLGLGPAHCHMTSPTKFGKGEWLTPATIDTVGKLGELGTPRLDVFCPGFVADCLETLEEIGLLNRDEFTRRGGGTFNRISCLNDSAKWVEALAALVRRHTAGWV
jgi:ferrochelatase